MAAPSVTNTFTDATTIDAVAAMENFNDVINGVSDGTKDISVSVAAAAGYAAITGDVYTTALTDYSGTATITGWASYTSQLIYYKRIGSVIHVWFNIAGVSNSTDTSFTIPVTNNSCVLQMRIPILTGTNELEEIGFVNLGVNTPPVAQIIYKLDGTNFLATGNKCVSGYFFYEVE